MFNELKKELVRVLPDYHFLMDTYNENPTRDTVENLLAFQVFIIKTFIDDVIAINPEHVPEDLR